MKKSYLQLSRGKKIEQQEILIKSHESLLLEIGIKSNLRIKTILNVLHVIILSNARCETLCGNLLYFSRSRDVTARENVKILVY